MRKWIWNKEICCRVCLSPTRGRHMPSFGAASGWRWHPLRCLSPLHSGPAPLLPSTLWTGRYPSLRFLLGYFPPVYHCFHAAASPPRIASIGGYDRSCARNQRPLLPANEPLSVSAAKPKKHVVGGRDAVFSALWEAIYPNTNAFCSTRKTDQALSIRNARRARGGSVCAEESGSHPSPRCTSNLSKAAWLQC